MPPAANFLSLLTGACRTVLPRVFRYAQVLGKEWYVWTGWGQMCPLDALYVSSLSKPEVDVSSITGAQPCIHCLAQSAR